MANGTQFPFAGPARTTPGVGLSPGLLGALNPRLGGLLAQVQGGQAPAQAPPGPGFLGRVFGHDPNLSAEQNRAAQRQALIAFGLQTLAASGPAPVRPGLGQVLAGGIGAGQQAAQTALQRSTRANLLQRIRSITESGQVLDTPELLDIFGEALSAGDIDMFRALSGVIPALQGGQQRRHTQIKAIEGKSGKPVEVLVDLDTGEIIREVGPAVRSTLGALAPTIVFDPMTKRNVIAAFDRGSNQYIEIGTGRVVSALPKAQALPPEQILTARGLLPAYEESLTVLESTVKSPNIAEKWASQRDIARWAVGDEGQTYFAAGMDLVSTLVLLRSGRQASDREREALYQALIPQPGEKPGTYQFKIRKLQRLLGVLRNTASGQPISPALETDFDQIDRTIEGGAGGKQGDVLDEF